MYTPPTHGEIIKYLKRTIEVAARAKALGSHPFGAIVVGPEGNIIAEQGNIDTVNHAESTICRIVYSNYPQSYLNRCTMYTSFEPCAMCSGTCYWAGIGGVVFGATEERLLAITGSHDQNPTMSMPCREVFSAGQRKVQVFGPFLELEDDIVADHLEFWKST
ncbi:CMP/dCMP deaminase zinc-binding protein [Umbelopsis sp. PMI_123]|nr:CMP/dCMP deaminase zinc-binding protein [Umbelopsis sp. PMI_123]